MEKYLTQQHLEQILKKMFHYEIIVDKVVPNSGIMTRPDFRIEELKILIEFDGYGHFCNQKTMTNDEKKDRVYSDMGYDIIHIPYFVQLDTQMSEFYFGKFELTLFTNSFPHGFIDKKATLPTEFTQRGHIKFRKLLESLPDNIKDEIIDSLYRKIISMNSYKKCSTLSIFYKTRNR